KLLAGRDARALETAKAAGAGRAVLGALAALFDTDRRVREAAAEGPGHRPLSTEARAALAGVRAALAGEGPARIRRRVAGADTICQRIRVLERAMATTPEEDQVAALSAKRAEAKAELSRAEEALAAVEAEQARVTREHAHKADRWARLAGKAAEARKAEETA